MRTIILFSLLAAPLILGATSLHIVSGDMEYVINSQDMGAVEYSAPNLVIRGREIPVAGISRMYVSPEDIADNCVTVSFASDKATVMAAWNIAPYIDCKVEGAHVSLVQSAEVDANIGEITYILNGNSSDGSFYLEGNYKSSIELTGLNLKNPDGSPFNIKNGKRISVSVKNGTVNCLEDGEGTQKGAISCTGHLEFKGKGELTVSGNVSHAVYAKEYIELKNCSLNILSAKKDGINCCQYFLMESGSVSMAGIDGDGIQVDYKDTADREEEDTGMITVKGGTLDIALTGVAAKGLKAEGAVDISGGEITITSSGNGQWDAAKSKTKASACIGSDENINISGGIMSLSASGSGGKGISCDGNLVVTGGDITVNTSGGILAYINGSENHNYTGNTDRLDSDVKSSPKGIKADGEIEINGGSFHIKTTGNGAEGIESKSTLTINDGEITVYSKDDSINSSGDMTINGGNILVVSYGNDGLDSNGNMYLNGGTVRAFGAGSPECGIDVNSEEGYVLVVTGGYILGVGGGSSLPTTSASTQPYVYGSLKVSPSTPVVISLYDEELASFDVPEDYVASSGIGGGWRPGGTGGGTQVFLSVPGMVTSTSYKLTCGTSSTTLTSALKGSTEGRPW